MNRRSTIGPAARARGAGIRGARLAFAIGGLALIALVVACGTGEPRRSRPSDLVREFLADVENERFADAYARIGPRWQAATTADGLRDQFADVTRGLGRLETLELRGMRVEDATATREVVYVGRFERGTARVVAMIVELDSGRLALSGLQMDLRLDPVTSDTVELPEGVTVNEGRGPRDDVAPDER